MVSTGGMKELIASVGHL